jgi:hypothetical protein
MDDSSHSNSAAVNDPGGPGHRKPGQPGPRDPGKIALAVNGVIAAVGGTYASTHSIAVTVVAGCAGLVCAAVIAWKS